MKDDDASSSGSSVSSTDISCSLTLPPVPTAAEVKAFKNGELQAPVKEHEDASSSEDSDSDDTDVSNSLTLPPIPTATEVEAFKNGELQQPQSTTNPSPLTKKEQDEKTSEKNASAKDEDDDGNNSSSDDESEMALAVPHLSPDKSSTSGTGDLAKALEEKSSQSPRKSTNSALSVISEASTVFSEASTVQTDNSNGSPKKKKDGTPKSPRKSKGTVDSSKANTSKSKKKSTDTKTKSKKASTATIDQPLPGNAACSAFMDRLFAHTAVQKWGIELPVIAVMGDTSSGKSSVLSQLCMLELPKSQSFTTRCPIRLQMKRSDVRKATVSVHWMSNIISKQYADFHEETVAGEDWDQIPLVIAQAQEHILEQTRRDVTNDIVCVDVQGPEYIRELTVVDLPGIMRSKAGIAEAETLRTEIAKLQTEYLGLERCIIVAVHPSNVDWHNAQITADALEKDPDTTRTVAVLTKPDLIDEGAEKDVVDLLQGRNLRFALGLHMIKSRGQAALDKKVTLEEALDEESRYFDSKEPWKSVRDRGLLGTANLRSKLGDLQMSMIKSTLPGIIQEIRGKQQKSAATLDAMGDLHRTPQDRRRYFQDVCRDIVSLISASLSGKRARSSGTLSPTGSSSVPQSAASRLHDDCSHFRDRIEEGSLATIRKIVEGGTVLVSGRRGLVRGEVVHLDSVFACVDYIDEEDRHSETLFEGTGMKHAGPEPIEENDVWSDATKVYIARDNNIYDSLRKIPLNTIRTDPSWLKAKIAGNRTDDLACFLNSDIFNKIVHDLIDEDWKPHALRLLELTRETLFSAMNMAVQTVLESDRYPPLRALISQQCHAASTEVINEAHKQIVAHFEAEKHPYTQDQALFEKIAAGRHFYLKCELESALKCDSEGVFDTQAIKAIMDGVFERHRLRSVEEQMSEELELVLDAYGSVAARRVVDRTPMVCWECFRSLPNAIRDALDVTDDVLQLYMQEDPAFVAKYNAALEEQEEMNKALEIFESIA